MGAKRSAEMKEALRLHGRGVNAHRAAKEAGVLPGSVYRVLRKQKANADRPSEAEVPALPALPSPPLQK